MLLGASNQRGCAGGALPRLDRRSCAGAAAGRRSAARDGRARSLQAYDAIMIAVVDLASCHRAGGRRSGEEGSRFRRCVSMGRASGRGVQRPVRVRGVCGECGRRQEDRRQPSAMPATASSRFMFISVLAMSEGSRPLRRITGGNGEKLGRNINSRRRS